MFTVEEQAIVNKTSTFLVQENDSLLKNFRGIMESDHPALNRYFTLNNQSREKHLRALLALVKNMVVKNVSLQELEKFISGVANKHASLSVESSLYESMGDCFIRAIDKTLEVLLESDKADLILDIKAVDDLNHIMQIWHRVYRKITKPLIEKEEALYQKGELAPGGWRGERAFFVAQKEKESETITSFYLKPVDGQPTIKHQAGQYLGVRFTLPNGQEKYRNYSISQIADGVSYRITLKHQAQEVKVGDKVFVSPPFGEFVLRPSSRPVVFISAGVAITPMIPLLQEAIKEGRAIYFLHATVDHQTDLFYDWLYEQVAHYEKLKVFKAYEDNRLQKGDMEGILNKEVLANILPVPHLDVYCLGAIPFMRMVRNSMMNLGVPPSQFYHEFFWPLDQLL